MQQEDIKNEINKTGARKVALNLFSANISRASALLTSIRSNGCFSCIK